MKRYSDEFRKEIHELAAQGVSGSELGRMYNIAEATIVSILNDHCDREKRLANKRLFKELHGKQDNKLIANVKETDNERFKVWCYKFKRKLNETMLFNNLPVIYVSDRWFTYKTATGYNKTINFIDAYTSRKGA